MQYVFELKDVGLYFNTIKRTSMIFTTSQSGLHRYTKKVVKALDGINLKVERGRTIGLIGRNGSGKTTLMRLLAGIYAPDSGEMICNSNSVVLLSLGVGFDNKLSGIENIYLSSMLNGLNHKQIDAQMKDIIDFAGVNEFIDAPLKTYSSGMRSRLAFSIAVHCNPEVLLIDEILSVGDQDFQSRSKKKLEQMINDKSKTAVIASHSMESIKYLCDEAIWLEAGKVRMIGDPESVTSAYKASF
jgi:teichoic acid transport system ATP-binding protein